MSRFKYPINHRRRLEIPNRHSLSKSKENGHSTSSCISAIPKNGCFSCFNLKCTCEYLWEKILEMHFPRKLPPKYYILDAVFIKVEATRSMAGPKLGHFVRSKICFFENHSKSFSYWKKSSYPMNFINV